MTDPQPPSPGEAQRARDRALHRLEQALYKIREVNETAAAMQHARETDNFADNIRRALGLRR